MDGMIDVRITDPEVELRKHTNGSFTFSIQEKDDVFTDVKIAVDDVEELIAVFNNDIFDGYSMSAVQFKDIVTVWIPTDKAKEIHEVLLTIANYGVLHKIL